MIFTRAAPHSKLKNAVFVIRYSFFLPILFLVACARQGVPTGGAKDTTPPQVDSTVSTPNYTTRFNKKTIELYFNEWVTVSDVAAQVVMSPPLLTKRVPDVRLKGKTVVVEIPEKEVLKENTTYTINFGTSIKDFHEGNAAKDLRFVFSTGDFIDSLTVQGKVTDAFKLGPVENVAVMLYDNLADSVLRKSKPYYYTRTDKQGLFKIQNVKAGQFKVAAVDDKDQNLLWNGSDEPLAFLSDPITMGDLLRPLAPLALQLFTDQPDLRLKDKTTRNFGQIKLTFNGSPDSVTLRSEPSGVRLIPEKQGDTLLVWYDRKDSTAWRLYVNQDTVPVKSTTRAAFLRNHKLAWRDEVVASVVSGSSRARQNTAAPAAGPTGIKTNTQHPDRPCKLPFNFPVAALDTARWRLYTDSNRVALFSVAPDSAQPRSVELRVGWKPEKLYEITLLPGAVTDLYGVANADTLRRRLSILSDKQLGNLSLTIKDLLPPNRYVLQLFNGATLEEERNFTAASSQQKLAFGKLPAATYTARLIEDRNDNRRWDAGNYTAHRQPEPIFEKKLPALRANWEVEATMQAGENVEETEKKKKE